MPNTINASSLQPYHIGSVITLTSYGPEDKQKNYDITGRLLTIQRTYDAAGIQTVAVTVVLEGAPEVVIPYNVQRHFQVEVHHIPR